MANWNNPTLTSSYTNFVTEVKDRDVEVALWFEGMSPTNLPTNAKRLNTSTGRFEKWNGIAWVDAVGTFTFPAMTVAGAATFNGNTTIGDAGTDTLTVNAAATFAAAASFNGNVTLGDAVGDTVTVNGTLTFAAAPVFTPGTANGVLFLNGSKVVSAGAALSFNGVNLAIGVAGSGWGAGYNAIDMNSGGAVYGTSTGINLASNLYFDGTSWKAKTAAAGGLYASYGGQHIFYSAASVAAGANAPLSLGVTFDQNGNVLIGGTAANGARLSIGAVPNTTIGTQSAFLAGSKSMFAGVAGLPQGQLFVYDTGSAAGSGGAISFGGNAGGGQETWYAAIEAQKDNATAGDYGGALVFYTRPSGSTPAERFRADSAGNLIAANSVTGHWRLPRGSTAQRPAGAGGMIRFNTDLNKYEGHNGTSWSSIGGGATGGGSDDIFYENGQTVSTNYSITSGKNAMSAGPITIASGITVTVPSGSTWVVV